MQTNEDIQIADIEIELDKLRGNKEGSGIHACPCLFNLIVHARRQEYREPLYDIIQSITKRFPCRVIFIQEVAGEQELRVNVSILQAEKSVSDLISIEVSEKLRRRVPFIVLPHLAPDSPVNLVWEQTAGNEDPLFQQFLSIAHRLIWIPDFTIEHFQKASAEVLDLKRQYPYLKISDLNWALLSGWRLALPQVFATPTEIGRLERAASLQIFYNTIGEHKLVHPEIQAIYLLGWLAGVFKWELSSCQENSEGFSIVCKKGAESFLATLSPQRIAEVPLGRVVGLELTTRDNLSYAIVPASEQAKVVVHISAALTCDLPFTIPMSSLKSGFPYVKELLYSLSSTPYQNMLKALFQCFSN